VIAVISQAITACESINQSIDIRLLWHDKMQANCVRLSPVKISNYIFSQADVILQTMLQSINQCFILFYSLTANIIGCRFG